METKKKLLPCPVCGCKKFNLINEIDTKITGIYCNNCPYGLEDNTKTLSELESIHNKRITICPTCKGDSVIADIAKRMGHRPDIAFAKIRRLEDRLIELGELDHTPCFICGYDGEDYFNPEIHKCMSRKNNESYMKNHSLTDDDLYE